MTKTLLDLDPALLERALALSEATTKRAVVTEALEEYVRRRATAEYLELLRSGIVDDLGDPEVMASAHR